MIRSAIYWGITIIFWVILLRLLVGCATVRTPFLFNLDFSSQKPESLIFAKCAGVDKTYEGGFACEEKTPRQADIWVKILPMRGRVIYSDGVQKKVEDFNYVRQGVWFWRKNKIDTTWVKLDIGDLTSTFGNVPIAFDVVGSSDKHGTIVNRGIIYHRICNDRDIPCSRLIVHFDCSGKIKNTFTGQLGFCNRLSESQQNFSIPVKGPDYELKAGAKIVVRAGRSGWVYSHTITASDVSLGEHKFIYPKVATGPELFSLQVFQNEQGIAVRYITSIVINGYSPKWTGIDQPHFVQYAGDLQVCKPVTSDVLEVSEGKRVVYTETESCISYRDPIKRNVCAYAFDRESSALSHNCLTKDGKEESLNEF